MAGRHQLQQKTAAEVNLTPMIDMVFILLIFFIVSTTFVKETGVDVERPEAKTAVTQKNSILISVTEDGEVWIDNRQVDIRSIRAHVERLLAESPESAVVVIADKAAHTGDVVVVMDQARLAGVSHIALAAQPPSR
ncbi:MAG TPA: biopolymer transporter ExbD [Chloroflexi bacterium]|nr:biopolymer transporter ExbD [Chloroflexota bacterium]